MLQITPKDVLAASIAPATPLWRRRVVDALDVLCLIAVLWFIAEPLWRIAPRYPAALLAEKPPGDAVIEFIIDREGRAQLPRIVSATHEAFGWAAAAAISPSGKTPSTAQIAGRGTTEEHDTARINRVLCKNGSRRQ